MPGPTASTTCGTSASVPTSAAPRALRLADAERAAVAAGLRALRDHGVGAAATARTRLVDRRHERQQRARRPRASPRPPAPDRRTSRSPTAPAASAPRRARRGDSAGGGSGGSSGSPSSRRNGSSTSTMRSRSPVAGVGRRQLHVDAERRRRARARARARCRARAARSSCPRRPTTPSPPARVTAATSSGVPGPWAMPASRIGTRMPSRSQSGVRSRLLIRRSIRPRG